MSNRFATVNARLAARMKSRIGNSVTYARAGETSLTLTVWRGKEQGLVVNPQGEVLRVDTTDRDYLILATDLTYGEPANGDRITDGSEVFELKPMQDNRAWRWSDESRKIYRVHAIQVT